jgi:hypothetical protein
MATAQIIDREKMMELSANQAGLVLGLSEAGEITVDVQDRIWMDFPEHYAGQ